MRIFWPATGLALILAGHAAAETHTLTLKQAVERALAQNPDATMARLDALKASQGIRVAEGPFRPRVGAGSGLAYTSGFPLTIDGSAPSIVEIKANQYLYNKPQQLAIEQAKETAKGSAIAVEEKADEIVYRVATLWLDFARAARLANSAAKQAESLRAIAEAAQTRADEGRELPVAAQQAKVNLLRAQQRTAAIEADRDFAGRSLAATLGYPDGDVVKPEGEGPAPVATGNEDAAVAKAIGSSREIKRLESNLAAKGLEIRGDRAQMLPRIDLVAQYSLLSTYTHYADYFVKYQPNNVQVGASIQVPLFVSSAVKAVVAQAETDQQHIRAEVLAAQNRVSLEVRQSYQEIRKAEMARQLAQADLDLSRSQLTVVLALADEGRATMAQIEEARFAENEKWIAFYDAEFSLERARLGVLRQTGELRAALN